MQLSRLSRALGEHKVVGCEEADAERVVKSAGRVLRILELFDVLRREALVSEVSDLLDMPQSSTSVLLRSLVVMGYLYYNPETRAFGPTTRVALLGSWINGPLVSDGPLMRLLERVNARTGLGVVLAARNQIWSQYIHVVQATDPIRIFVVKGSKRPLVRSGTGHALLADLPDADIKRIAVRSNAEAREGEPLVCISALLEQVAAVRANGYAISHNAVTEGAGVIAMRLPRLINEERFVVGVSGTTDILRERQDDIVMALHEEIGGHFATVEPDRPVTHC